MKKKWKYLYFLIPITILIIVLGIGIKNERSGYRKVNGGYLYRFKTENYKTVYTEEFQKDRDKEIEDIKNTRNYSFQNSFNNCIYLFSFRTILFRFSCFNLRFSCLLSIVSYIFFIHSKPEIILDSEYK